jgi:MFS family permease
MRDKKMSNTISMENDQSQSSSSPFKGNFTIIALSSVVKGFGGGLISAYVSLYFVELGGSPVTLGLMAAVASIIGSVMFLLGGFIADFYGRKRIIVFAAFYGAFFPLSYVIVQDWLLFAALNVVAAFGLVSSPAVHALVVDSISLGKRTIGLASLQVLSSLPVAVAPLIGGWLIQNNGMMGGFRLACIYAGISALISTFTLLLLKETLQCGFNAESGLQKNNRLKGIMEFPRSLSASLKGLMLSYGLVAFANGAVGQYYILYASSVVGLTPLEWAPIASLQSLVIILKIPGGWLSDKFGKRKIMMFSVLACAPCGVLFTLSRSFFQVLIVSLLQLNGGLSTAAGTLLGGFAFQAVDPTAPFYLFTAAEFVAVFFLISLVREPEKKEI